ncbi:MULTISPECIES: hypothetical protein [unclassified Thioclava]|uniref:hypothetical protein n=1 Tax=unclassified Thioclava TaxID=2621713 RepID=UPI001FEF30B2|nr:MULTISPECIES: hypothetical protein [unclassified Thioclava]
MPQTGQPLFLARRSYRRRRLMDAARLLPIVGLVLIMMPGLWHPAQTPVPDTGRGGLYLFAVWIVLILAAFAISRGLGPVLNAEDVPEGNGEAEGPTAAATASRASDAPPPEG